MSPMHFLRWGHVLFGETGYRTLSAGTIKYTGRPLEGSRPAGARRGDVTGRPARFDREPFTLAVRASYSPRAKPLLR